MVAEWYFELLNKVCIMASSGRPKICQVVLMNVIGLIFCVSSHPCRSQGKYNLDFEAGRSNAIYPEGWGVGEINGLGLPTNSNEQTWYLDSINKYEGNYALCLDLQSAIKPYIASGYAITSNQLDSGHQILLTGYVKTENITNGYAGLWLRVDGYNKMLAFDNMSRNGIIGTTNWKKYSVELPYKSDEAVKIIFGGLLVGTGKMWLDKLDVYIDGVNIQDKNDKIGDGAPNIILNDFAVNNLAKLCELWGFLKYHHPNITSGKYDMDKELFKAILSVQKVNSKDEFNKLIEDWIDSFGSISKCDNCVQMDARKANIRQLPEYDMLFKKDSFNQSIETKLNEILRNRNIVNEQYYVETDQASNPKFSNEKAYPYGNYNDVGLRLLALFRYWNMVQYFYPYRYLLEEKWNNVLRDFIPRIIASGTKEQFILSMLQLIEQIGDSHAGLFNNDILEKIKGEYFVPFESSFVDGKLVVTGFSLLRDEHKSQFAKQNVKIGDEIKMIDDTSVKELAGKYLPYTTGSNIGCKLRDLPSIGGFLFRSDKSTEIKLQIRRGNKLSIVKLPRIKLSEIAKLSSMQGDLGYSLISSDVGYIRADKLTNSDLDNIRLLFKNTRGIIFDMRNYPSIDMRYSFANWIKPQLSPFAIISRVDINYPGASFVTDTVSVGGGGMDHYSGKVVVIVNSNTQSNGEFTTMAFQSRDNTIILGSTTAGADGNISKIVLPFGITTFFSGLGVYYPNGAETQKVGIKIDVVCSPTQKDIINKNDVLLNKAVEIITKH